MNACCQNQLIENSATSAFILNVLSSTCPLELLNLPGWLVIGIFHRRITFFSALYVRIVSPLVFGDYPDTMKKTAGSRIPAFTNHESETG